MRRCIEAKRRGLARAGEIAHREAPRLGLDAGFCRRYLANILHFDLGPREQAGLHHYYMLACELGLAPRGVSLEYLPSSASCGKPLTASRLTPEEGVALFDCRDLPALGRAADAVCRRLHPEPYRTYNIDRNINYTNVCAAVCDFCAFYRKSNDADAYVLPREVIYQKIEETIALGGDQTLMQGGMHPSLKLEWYEDLLRDLKSRYPNFNLHAFSPPEIWHFHKINKLPLREVLRRLKDAGLGSLPGGGGEILVDRVRKAMTVNKCLTDEWLEVHRVWHELGGRSTCTMMFGHIETLAERIETLERLRQLQDETGGFTAFICWTFQPEHTAMADVPPAGAFEYLQDAGHRPALPGQHSQHPVVVGDAGAEDRPARAVLRRQRHGQPDDRGKRRRLGGHGPSPDAGADQERHPRGGLYPAAAECVLRVHRRGPGTARRERGCCLSGR